jgi:hypothetical protein
LTHFSICRSAARGPLPLISALALVASLGCESLDESESDFVVDEVELIVDGEAPRCGDAPAVVTVGDDGETSVSCELPELTEEVPYYCLLGNRDFWLGWNAGSYIYVCVNGACGRAYFRTNETRYGRWGWVYRASSGSLCTN